MEHLDLDIQNYNLEEILELFKVPYNFGEEELKNSYKMYLMTHPDKSGLDKNVFLFFGKAYNILKKIYNFRNKKIINSKTYETIDIGENDAKLLNKLNGKSVKDFNNWFNEMFEKVRIKDDDEKNGYGEWYKDYKDKDIEKVTMSQFQNEFNKKREENGQIVLRNEVLEMENSNGYDLDRGAPSEYSSNIFSNLSYEDLKKAHTETIVPVSDNELKMREKFNNVEQFKRHRSDQNTKPLSIQQSKEYLKERENKQDVVDTRRIYNILKQDEQSKISNDRWWGYLKQLE